MRGYYYKMRMVMHIATVLLMPDWIFFFFLLLMRDDGLLWNYGGLCELLNDDVEGGVCPRKSTFTYVDRLRQPLEALISPSHNDLDMGRHTGKTDGRRTT